ncbi:helix-turn-helix domain-containing protein [Bacillus sp. FJAT-49736]|uniref:helix-turn-helix domain-containing protein n=1 Tax=Bacillus sp. FJAT-49736 TaxID=2833582 RepID=UPI001BC9C636|nr:helix-turn-helix domain-containing protein [Bacillus sp. FJAT-49736]MBS4173313.1 helix-turn-helix domain-containing protein [Bacillus sp. FJAT-49736]
MTFLEAIILWALKKLKGERTVYSVFHLLKGKKSSQTIQDAYLYQLDILFYTFPHLTRRDFDISLESLADKSFIILHSNKRYFLTEQGENQLEVFFAIHSFPAYLNGLKYQEHSFTFWNRLVIIIQVLSNLINKNRFYYPVTRDNGILRWVKQFLNNHNKLKDLLAESLFTELHLLLSNNPPERPEIIVMRLTGYKHIGKTVEQSANQLEMDVTEYWFRYVNLLHYVMEHISENKASYPLLFSIIQDTYKPFSMTKSTFETYELLLKNYSIAEISRIRNLKESTIQDHIIEIALSTPDFNTNPFIDSKTEAEILAIADNIGMQKLKPIKDQINRVSYFQIRLALAKNR